MTSRRCFSLAAGAAAAMLAACAGESAPQRFYRLPLAVPAGEPAPRAAGGSAAGGSAAGATWELASPLPIPELLNRETLLVEEGAAGIRLLHGHRWAEPLRDTLPQLLRHDLALLVPGLWTGLSAPAGAAAPGGQVQVELLALQGSLPRREVVLSARWVVTRSAAAPRAFRTDEAVPWSDGSVESLVVAQRVAMWRLAQRIAASLEGA
jgi:uncharacterized lipoprotein YmbA